jgi:endonuclease/exonuclease/phosphatase family metal-dependent hydrolase
MTTIVTWNIQCAKGVDGEVDPGRIAEVARGWGEPDVLCLQEVARFMPDLDGGAGADQVEAFATLFPGHEPVFGPALDRPGDMPGRRRQFGNLILSRFTALQAFRHLLPFPPEPAVKRMRRQATEVIVQTETGPLRIVTTHLEFHSETQRLAQAGALRILHAESADNAARPPAAADGPYAPPPWPASCVVCGDFNIMPDDAVYAKLTAPFATGTPTLTDAWRALHGDRPHDPTCGIFDREQWPQGPHCRDFFLATPDVAARIGRLEVNQQTDASDHQPLLLELR